MDKLLYKSAIIRHVPDSMAEDALRMDSDGPAVSMERAKLQHHEYVNTLRNAGLKVIELDADHALPDSVFVEDPVVVVGTKALLTNQICSSRQPERNEMERILQTIPGLELYRMEEIDPQAYMDGGDFLFTGQEIFIGQTTRTNERAVQVLSQVFSDYKVIPIRVENGLHLKSICTLAAPGIIIGSIADEIYRENFKKLQAAATGHYKYVEIKEIPCAANGVYLETDKGPALLHNPSSDNLGMEEVFKIRKDIKGYAVDTSEFGKVDGCLTCMSVLLTV